MVYGKDKDGKAEAVCLYAHWGGEAMPVMLANALKRGKERWDDPMYLGRIIFSELVKDDIEGLTGIGVAPYIGEEEYRTLEVDMEKQDVNGLTFEQFVAEHATA